MAKSRIRIKILDAIPGADDHIRLNKARMYVEQQDAEWVEVGVSIRFLQVRRAAAVAQVERDMNYDRLSQSGLIQPHHLRHTPLLGPDAYVKLVTRPTMSRVGVVKRSKKILMRNGIACVGAQDA